MIAVVLKKDSNFADFEALLSQQGYTYKKYFKRVYYIECDLPDFVCKAYEDIETCEIPTTGKLEPQSVDVVDSNILTRGNASYVNGTHPSWGPHRIIRRKNPFNRQKRSMETDFTLPYKTQRSGIGVDIYVLDVFIHTDHQEFAGGRVAYAGGVALEGVSVGDTNFEYNAGFIPHGSMVCGCAGGNLTGIARGAQMHFICFAMPRGEEEIHYLEEMQIVYAHYMNRADTNRPAIVNISWKWVPNGSPSAAITAAYEDMMDAGLIVVVSAGNGRGDLDTEFSIPGESHPDIVVVGATDAYDLPMWLPRAERTVGTAVGSPVDIYAPGTNIPLTTVTGYDSYQVANGTSFASPYTAGVLACMLEGYGRLQNITQVRAVIQKLLDNSTKGALRFGDVYYKNSVVHNRLLYLDPFVAIEPIDGLTPL